MDLYEQIGMWNKFTIYDSEYWCCVYDEWNFYSRHEHPKEVQSILDELQELIDSGLARTYFHTERPQGPLYVHVEYTGTAREVVAYQQGIQI
jgi:hypothetical protein